MVDLLLVLVQLFCVDLIAASFDEIIRLILPAVYYNEDYEKIKITTGIPNSGSCPATRSEKGPKLQPSIKKLGKGSPPGKAMTGCLVTLRARKNCASAYHAIAKRRGFIMFYYWVIKVKNTLICMEIKEYKMELFYR